MGDVVRRNFRNKAEMSAAGSLIMKRSSYTLREDERRMVVMEEERRGEEPVVTRLPLFSRCPITNKARLETPSGQQDGSYSVKQHLKHVCQQLRFSLSRRVLCIAMELRQRPGSAPVWLQAAWSSRGARGNPLQW